MQVNGAVQTFDKVNFSDIVYRYNKNITGLYTE